MKKLSFILSGFILLLIDQTSAFAQGSLGPANAPAPAMKSLQQLEPRIEITSLPFEIFTSGSYFLGRNLTLSEPNTDGLTIYADNVTLDLNGFILRGPGATSGYGIFQTEYARNLTVRNGTLAGWAGATRYGIYARSGARADGVAVTEGCNGILVGAGSRILCCTVMSNMVGVSFFGIAAGEGSVVSRCSVSFNQAVIQGIGVLAGGGCVVTDCSVYNNAGPYEFQGIQVGAGSLASRNSIHQNSAQAGGLSLLTGVKAGETCVMADNVVAWGGSAGTNLGVKAGSGSVIKGCVVQNNFASGGALGFQTGAGSVLSDCRAGTMQGGNLAEGFRAEYGSVLTRCMAVGNLSAGPVNGLFANGASVVTDCAATTNYSVSEACTGIRVEHGSVLLRSTALANAGGLLSSGLRADASLVGDCLAEDNNRAGLWLESFCWVMGNTFINNSQLSPISSTEANIYAKGSGNRIEANTISSPTGYAWTLEGEFNFFARNMNPGLGMTYWQNNSLVGIFAHRWYEVSAWENIEPSE